MQLNQFEYEVMAKGNDAMVDFVQRHCLCHVVDIVRLSCVHVIAANEQAGMQICDLCSDYYKFSTQMLANVETIYLVPPKDEWDVPEDEVIIDVSPLCQT